MKKTPTKHLLCCIVSPHIMCRYCGTKFCEPCGKPFGESKHFIVGQCRRRYKPEHISEAEECEQFKAAAKLKGYNLPHTRKCRPCKSYSKGRTDRKIITL
jgi:hypothetical protein